MQVQVFNDPDKSPIWEGELADLLASNQEGLSAEELLILTTLQPGEECAVGGGAAEHFTVKALLEA